MLLLAGAMLSSCSMLVVGPGVPAPEARGSRVEAGAPESQDVPRFAFWWHVTGKEEVGAGAAPAGTRTDVAFLYEHEAGEYPRVYEGREQYGGVPQRADIPAHLRELARDIQREIPDPNFSGLAVLDYESWEPVWSLTKPEYKEISRRLVRQNSPGRAEADVERLAEANYESAAKKFLLETINEARRQRPKAKWGFYAWPWPTYAGLRADKMQWMWDASDAIYPCLYAVKQGVGPTQTAKAGQWEVARYMDDMRGRVALAKRAAGGKPVYALLWVRYDFMSKEFGGQFLSEPDLAAALRVPREAGAAGAVFWNQSETRAEAADLRRFVAERLVRALRDVQNP